MPLTNKDGSNYFGRMVPASMGGNRGGNRGVTTQAIRGPSLAPLGKRDQGEGQRAAAQQAFAQPLVPAGMGAPPQQAAAMNLPAMSKGTRTSSSPNFLLSTMAANVGNMQGEAMRRGANADRIEKRGQPGDAMRAAGQRSQAQAAQTGADIRSGVLGFDPMARQLRGDENTRQNSLVGAEVGESGSRATLNNANANTLVPALADSERMQGQAGLMAAEGERAAGMGEGAYQTEQANDMKESRIPRINGMRLQNQQAAGMLPLTLDAAKAGIEAQRAQTEAYPGGFDVAKRTAELERIQSQTALNQKKAEGDGLEELLAEEAPVAPAAAPAQAAPAQPAVAPAAAPQQQAAAGGAQRYFQRNQKTGQRQEWVNGQWVDVAG